MVRPLPLGDIHVIDLTRARAGPTAVRHLADWGANVIRIEDLVGPDAAAGLGLRDDADFQNLHRNKRSITVNLKAPEGKEVFFRLAKKADVIIENYRPDVKRRLGIDYEAVKAVNPRAIYGSISGFGQEGPYRNRPGVDQIIQGMSGLMTMTGEPGRGPMRVGIAVSDVTAGLTLAYGIMVALHERERTGEGQWVQTSLIEAMIAHLDFQAARWLIDHEVPEQAGNDHPILMPTGILQTSDGYINLAATGTRYPTLCNAIERPDLIDHPDYKTSPLRSKNRVALMETLAEITRTRTSAEWVELLNKAGVPCGPIYTVDQTFNDPQIKSLNMNRPVEHPRLGHQELVGQALSLSAAGGRPDVRMHAPEYDQDTLEVLAEYGYSQAEIETLRAAGVV